MYTLVINEKIYLKVIRNKIFSLFKTYKLKDIYTYACIHDFFVVAC